jgi:hypothetical protein
MSVINFISILICFPHANLKLMLGRCESLVWTASVHRWSRLALLHVSQHFVNK